MPSSGVNTGSGTSTIYGIWGSFLLANVPNFNQQEKNRIQIYRIVGGARRTFQL
jgi:hypothetical protein